MLSPAAGVSRAGAASAPDHAGQMHAQGVFLLSLSLVLARVARGRAEPAPPGGSGSPTPVLNTLRGITVFTRSADVHISCDGPAAANATGSDAGPLVTYTLDGQEPTAESAEVPADGLLTIEALGRTVLWVRCALGALAPSFAKGTYTVRERARKPSVSVSGPEASAPANGTAGGGHAVFEGSAELLVAAEPGAAVFYGTGGAPVKDADHRVAGGRLEWREVGVSTLRFVASSANLSDSEVVSVTLEVVRPPRTSVAAGNAPEAALVDWSDLSRYAANARQSPANVSVRVVNTVIDGKRHRGRLVSLSNPLRHFSVLPPVGGCDGHLSLPSEVGRAYNPLRPVVYLPKGVGAPAGAFAVGADAYEAAVGRGAPAPSPSGGAEVRLEALPAGAFGGAVGGCRVASNAGFFDTKRRKCVGHVVSDGQVLLSGGGRSSSLAVGADGRLVTGYLSGEGVLAGEYAQAVSGALWLVRDGAPNLELSLREEWLGQQETGSKERFAGVRSARTAAGFDAGGRLLLLQMEGRTDEYGLSLWEMEALLLRLGFRSAVNLDGGGSASMTQNHALVSEPSWACDGDRDDLFACEKEVATVACFHDDPLPLYVIADGGGEGGGDSGGGAGASEGGGGAGASEGESTGASKGESTGASKGESTGGSKGESTGASKGESTGASEGDSEGSPAGSTAGSREGSTGAAAAEQKRGAPRGARGGALAATEAARLESSAAAWRSAAIALFFALGACLSVLALHTRRKRYARPRGFEGAVPPAAPLAAFADGPSLDDEDVELNPFSRRASARRLY